GGTSENSPALERWNQPTETSSPEGTAETPNRSSICNSQCNPSSRLESGIENWSLRIYYLSLGRAAGWGTFLSKTPPFCPEGTSENSPALERWDHPAETSSPEGTAETPAACCARRRARGDAP